MENLEQEVDIYEGDLIDETIAWLDEQILKAENGEEAKKFAEAFKAKAEGEAKLLQAKSDLIQAEAEELKNAQATETERKKNKLVCFATIGAAVLGAGITGGLKILGDILFVEKIADAENCENPTFINTKKYKR